MSRPAGGARLSTRSTSSKRTAPVGEQRIYHLTHVSNLPQIVAASMLLADSNDAWDERPTVDISASATREKRRSATVSTANDLVVADFVPFFLSPNASVWETIRSQTEDPRLSAEAHRSSAYDFVILVSTVQTVFDHNEGVVVTDGDAAGTMTRFGTSRESSERMLRNLRADEESETILEAEVLVPHAAPFELVTLIGVVNDGVRSKVKSILKASEHQPKVSVYPPWFQPAERDR
jgi:hypothetical protein